MNKKQCEELLNNINANTKRMLAHRMRTERGLIQIPRVSYQIFLELKNKIPELNEEEIRSKYEYILHEASLCDNILVQKYYSQNEIPGPGIYLCFNGTW